MKNLNLILAVFFILTASAGTAATIPNLWGEWEWNITELVQVMNTPGGGGHPLSAANYLGGPTVDATIRIQLWVQGDDPEGPNDPMPVANFPGEDIWLEIPGTVWCQGGEATADGPTDDQGWFTFSQALNMGGWSDPEGDPPLVTVMVNGAPLHGLQGEPIWPTIVFNSPDINADLSVNLMDLSVFVPDYFGDYAFRSDFFWDGVLNLSDVAFMAIHMGEECP